MKLKFTWKFYIYLAVLALSALPAIMVNTVLGYGPMLLVLFCGLLSFGWLFLLRKQLAFAVNTPVQSCIRGESVQFQISLKNAGRLPAVGVTLVFYTSSPEDLEVQTKRISLTLAPGETRSFGIEASFPHVGVYRAGIRRMELLDTFGIFQLFRQTEQCFTVEVLPRMVQLPSLPVTSNVQTQSTKMTVQTPLNGSDYTSVREYAFGDPIKNIHWKLSAHVGGLMTKQMESYSNTGVSVVLNLQIPAADGAARLEEFDAIVEAGTAAGCYAAERGMDYELLFYRLSGAEVRAVPSSFRALNGLVGELRLAEPAPKWDMVRLLRKHCQGVYSQANVVVCSAILPVELAETLVALKQGGRTPILFLILSKKLPAQEREARMENLRLLRHANIACRVLAGAEELEV